jgi:ribosomal protein S18 acetylase RimI-like enzyme
LAVDPILAGQGIGKKLCQFAEKHARDLGGGIIRLDTYTKNPASNRLYESLAYELADGFCYFHGLKSPFNCYEKKLE